MAFSRDDSGTSIPEEVQTLLLMYVKSVGHLETLLYLFNHKDQEFTALEMSKELRTNEAYALLQLSELDGIVAKVGELFRYNGNAEIDVSVRALAQTSRERPHAVINFIYSKPVSPTPRDSILSFADAFKLKKD